MEPDYVKTFAKTTLSAGTLLSDTYIVYLLSNSLVVLNGGWSLSLAAASITSGADPAILQTCRNGNASPCQKARKRGLQSLRIRMSSSRQTRRYPFYSALVQKPDAWRVPLCRIL